MNELIKYLCSITKQLKKSRKGNGINCYDVEAITKHKKHIEDLCASCGWFLKYSPPKSYLDENDEKQSSSASYYCGKSTIENDSEADLLEAFGD